jgi:hypothetical protein
LYNQIKIVFYRDKMNKQTNRLNHPSGKIRFSFLILVWIFCGCFNPQPTSRRVKLELAPQINTETRHSPTVDHAIIISLDGLGALYLKPMLDKNELPAIRTLQQKGAWTHDARSDFFSTVTLPNHTSMITGLPLSPTPGASQKAYHGYIHNALPAPGATLHNAGNPNRTYIPSMFDVAHDFGLKTCLFASKSKFVVFDRSYDQEHGATDRIGADNGRDKIDQAVIYEDSTVLTAKFIQTMETASPCDLTFFHIADPDAAGHQYGWGSSGWQQQVIKTDGLVQRILDAVSNHETMAKRTAIIVTADHGGYGMSHADTRLKENFTIPFYLIAPTIPAGADLYDVYKKTRARKPGINPSYQISPQPIRDGDVGNLALALLGLPPIPDSVIFGMTRE